MEYVFIIGGMGRNYLNTSMKMGNQTDNLSTTMKMGQNKRKATLSTGNYKDNKSDIMKMDS